MGKKRSLAHALARDAGARLFYMFWAALVVVDVADAARAPSGVAVGGMALLVVQASRGQHPGTAAAAAAMGWLFVNGFSENRLGELHWHGGADVRLLLLLLAAAVVGSHAGIDGVLTRTRRDRSDARVGSAAFRRPVRIGK